MTDEEVVEEVTEEVIEEPTEEVESEEEVVETPEESEEETPEAKIARLSRQNKQLKKKLEKPAEPPKEINQSDYLEERLEMIASGENKDVIKEALDIAKVKGITLEEAMKSPLITSYKKTLEAKAKSEAASLGASGKSATTKTEEVFKSGLTREEHKKAVMEYQEKNK